MQTITMIAALLFLAPASTLAATPNCDMWTTPTSFGCGDEWRCESDGRTLRCEDGDSKWTEDGDVFDLVNATHESADGWCSTDKQKCSLTCGTFAACNCKPHTGTDHWDCRCCIGGYCETTVDWQGCPL